MASDRRPAPPAVMSSKFSRRSALKALGGAGLFIAAPGVLAACGSGDATTDTSAPSSVAKIDDLVKKAKAEGEVTAYYATGEDDTRQWVKAFTTKYGITVNHYRAPTPTAYSRFQQEEGAGKHLADCLILSDMAIWRDAVKAKLIASYTPQSDGDYPDDLSQSGSFYPLYVYAEAVTWNTDKTSADERKALETTGLAALTDAAFKGRIGMATAASSTAIYAEYARIAKSPKYGWEYLEAIAKLSPKFYPSADPAMGQLTAGEVSVLLAQNDTLSGPAVLKGAPIQWRYDDEQVTGVPFEIGLSAQAPHPYAARLFQEWATSPEGVQSMCDIRQAVAVNTKVKDDRKITAQPWYQTPSSLYVDWSTNDDLLNARADFLTRWAKVFGPNG